MTFFKRILDWLDEPILGRKVERPVSDDGEDGLHWKLRVTEARLRRARFERDAAFKEAERYRELWLLDHPEYQ